MSVLQKLSALLYRPIINLSALVWLINGLFCKLLGLVPRHEQIVSEILSEKYATHLTYLIGISEMAMTVWILSGYYRKLNVATQIAIVLSMNIIELALVPELLLWGTANFIFALLFCLIIFFNEYVHKMNL